MTATTKLIYSNPHLPGHSLLKPINYAYKHISEALNAINSPDVSDEMRGQLNLMANGPIQLTTAQICSFRISNSTSESELPSLSGIKFGVDWEAPNTYKVCIISVKKESCGKRTHLLAVTTLAVVTAPITLPAAALGLAIKSSLYFCSKRTLSIEEIDPKDYPKMVKIALDWQAKAHDLEDLDNKNSELFHDCAKISKLARQCFEDPSSCWEIFDKAYVCKDSWGVIQGLMLTRDDYNEIKIAHLVTHPHNIRSPLNATDPETITGVGTALTTHAAQRCLDLNKARLYLEGTESATTFYENYGFEKIANPIFIEDGDYAMKMSAQKIKDKLHFHQKAA